MFDFSDLDDEEIQIMQTILGGGDVPGDVSQAPRTAHVARRTSNPHKVIAGLILAGMVFLLGTLVFVSLSITNLEATLTFFGLVALVGLGVGLIARKVRR